MSNPQEDDALDIVIRMKKTIQIAVNKEKLRKLGVRINEFAIVD